MKDQHLVYNYHIRMIKKIGLVIVLASCSFVVVGQNQYADSLEVILATTTNPVDRFDLLNHILLDITSYRGSNIDSAATLQMLEIAQELNNDSLKAISYNWLGTYFYQQKGDNASALEYYFKALPLAEKINEKRRISSIYFDMALVYFDMLDYEKALEITRKGGENLPDISHPLYDFMLLQFEANMTQYFLIIKQADSASYYAQKCHETTERFNQGFSNTFLDYVNLAAASAISSDNQKANEYFIAALSLQDSVENITSQLIFYNNYIPFLLANGRYVEGLRESRKLLDMGLQANNNNLKIAGAAFLRQFYDALNKIDSAYYYSQAEAKINSQIFSQENKNKVQALDFNNKLRSIEEKNKAAAYQNQLKLYGLMGGLGMVLLISFILFRNNRQKQKANVVLKEQKEEIQTTLEKLESTQSQLIQSEKMASLGELTAGIAHEIQNPLNFVNNFSEVNSELIEELEAERSKVKGERDEDLEKEILNDIKENEQKIKLHGQRASGIVKGMLEHSRTSEGKKELTDINALADEYLRLAYHGLRAKDNSFNADFKLEADKNLPLINVIPQDIGRVLLNLINNAFFAVTQKANRHSERSEESENYQPKVVVSTRQLDGQLEISVKDNGSGIPAEIKDKIFQPFFTTKPTGSGTGLGLSLSYDIVKAHGGELKVESEVGKGSEFVIQLSIV